MHVLENFRPGALLWREAQQGRTLFSACGFPPHPQGVKQAQNVPAGGKHCSKPREDGDEPNRPRAAKGAECLREAGGRPGVHSPRKKGG